MTKILSVLPQVPYPADTGGALRALHLLTGLDRRFEVTVLAGSRPDRDVEGFRRLIRGEVVVVEPQGWIGRLSSELPSIVKGVPLGYSKYASPAFARALVRLLANCSFDLVHFDHLHPAQLIPCVRRLQPRAKVVIDEHNVESQIIERVASLSSGAKGALLRWTFERLKRLEADLLSRADLVLGCSTLDAAGLRWLGAKEVRVVPNGVDPTSTRAAIEGPRKDLVFVGSLDWWPNEDAALLLANEIWPNVCGDLAGAKLKIVGRNPPKSVREIDVEGVEVVGTVPAVAPYLAGAFATAMPLRAGSGTRLKILEAAAAGVPIVATRIAAEGLPLVDGRDLLFAETAAEFVAAIKRLWSDRSLARRLAQNAAQVAEEMSWQKISSDLAEFYSSWIASSAGEPTPFSAESATP